MVTPFTEDLAIDYRALDAMIEWYLEAGVHGLFAVCQSSEMFFLDLEERVELARRCVKAVAGRVPVIASGHVSEGKSDQIDELTRMADTGVDAVVLVVNRLTAAGGSEDGWIRNLRRLLRRLPANIPLGFYECPYPDNVKLSDHMVSALRDTDRFAFIKDTTCRLEAMKRKLEILRESSVKVFNANAATLLASLRAGVNGYSGVMANFHPELYVELWNRRADLSEETELLASYLALASVIERQYYPVNAHYFLQLSGLPITPASRRLDVSGFTESMRREVEQFHRLNRRIVDEVKSV